MGEKWVELDRQLFHAEAIRLVAAIRSDPLRFAHFSVFIVESHAIHDSLGLVGSMALKRLRVGFASVGVDDDSNDDCCVVDDYTNRLLFHSRREA